MRPSSIIFLLGLLFPTFCLAQSNFKDGYIVTSKGDTSRGMIDQKNWGQNPESVRFKTNSGQIADHTVADISAFGINNLDHYERYTLPITMDRADLSALGSGIDTERKVVNVFLRVVTRGKYLTLYQYTDIIKTRYFILDKERSAPRELTYRVYADADQDNKMVTNRIYRNELTSYAYKYGKTDPEINNLIASANYNDDITEIVNLINGENKHQRAADGRITNRKYNVRFYAGASGNRATFTYTGNIDLSIRPVKTPVYYAQFSAGFDIYQRSDISRFVIRGDISYYSMAITAASGNVTEKIKQQNFSFCPQLMYDVYNSKPLKAFIDLGVRINWSSYPQNTYTTDLGAFTTTDTPPTLSTTWLSVPVKAGLVFQNRIELYGCYTPPASIASKNKDYNGNLSSLQAGINILFGK